MCVCLSVSVCLCVNCHLASVCLIQSFVAVVVISVCEFIHTHTGLADVLDVLQYILHKSQQMQNMLAERKDFMHVLLVHHKSPLFMMTWNR
jgi:hypothetical protein